MFVTSGDVAGQSQSQKPAEEAMTAVLYSGL
jgi:hypothetical protein